MEYLIFQPDKLNAPLPPFILDAEEERQAERRGGAFRVIRTLLKLELARRTGIPAQDIHFDTGPHGKPLFAPQPFNISHSGNCLCLAFHSRDVGVDVEKMRPRNFDKLAAQFMSPELLEHFRAGGCREEVFFSAWCVAEALVKHAGDTIWNARHYPFLIQDGIVCPTYEQAPQVELFTPMAGYRGAVAYTAGATSLTCKLPQSG